MKTIIFDAVVIGTGAAGYNTACRIKQEGKKSVCIVTEGIKFGTSRNTGSDKQTYYKLGLGGDSADSVRKMAENLFSCGAVDGDNALCEAALSARCFLNLCELGVPFPVNRYGEYVGYKTDHDPFARATSAGPLTSKFMTEALQKQADKLGIAVFDGLLAIEILKCQNSVCGIIALDKKSGELVAFRCRDVVLATGGPAGIYKDSVYPVSQNGATGLALLAGASLQNMTEWQYGLASVAPRWNVSGTYMQVLPRFVSVDDEGNESEFLLSFFKDPYKAMSAVFLKGYQWPFDSQKVLEGSSVIDLLVYRESVLKKRKVYLDFTKNPFGIENIDYSRLSEEAHDYLENAGACFGTPIERLDRMNRPAVQLYESKGVDISLKYLQIALCAQHNNGGIAVDLWWQTEVKGLFAVGECAGTHGITRPGGSALNAGQVGSLRAAQFISNSVKEQIPDDAFNDIVQEAEKKHTAFKDAIIGNEDNVRAITEEAQEIMSNYGAAIRNLSEMEKLKGFICEKLASFEACIGVRSCDQVYRAYILKSILLTQLAVVEAMIDFSVKMCATRGSALYYDKNGFLREGLEEMFRFTPGKKLSGDKIQQVKLSGKHMSASMRDVRPLPKDDDFFENVWKKYRENRNIY